MEIKIAYLYPDILNLHGDRGNIWALERICQELGIKSAVERIDDIEDDLEFSKYDFILISPGILSALPLVIEKFNNQKEDLLKYLDNDGYMLVIGSSAAIFAKEVNRIGRHSYSGVNIGNFSCNERELIYGDDLIYKMKNNDEELEIIGSQIQLFDIISDKNFNPVGEITYGYGNNHNDQEGIRYKNLIITNLVGPIFVKNPWLAKNIILDICSKKGYKVKDKELDFSLEEKSKDAIIRFNFEKETEL